MRTFCYLVLDVTNKILCESCPQNNLVNTWYMPGL